MADKQKWDEGPQPAKVAVVLQKHHGGCNPGETAGFPAAEAAKLIDAGVASLPGGGATANKAILDSPKDKAAKPGKTKKWPRGSKD